MQSIENADSKQITKKAHATNVKQSKIEKKYNRRGWSADRQTLVQRENISMYDSRRLRLQEWEIDCMVNCGREKHRNRSLTEA